MTSRDKYRRIALEAVRLAEREVKGDRDYSSSLDVRIERLVRQFLAEASPEIASVGEEEGGDHDEAEPWWCLDPINGTVNFDHGSPLFAISLALIESGKPTVGVVSLPAMAMRYYASLGAGARCNDQPIETSADNIELNAAVVAIGDYAVGEESADQNKIQIAITERLANTVLRVRMHGSAAIDLVWLADGKIDAALIMAANPWAVAAGVIIAQEAGAEITDLDGNEYVARRSGLIGATAGIHESLDTGLLVVSDGDEASVIRGRLVIIADELRVSADDDFATKHRLNTEADELRQRLSELTDDDATRATMESWATRSGRKNAQQTDYDVEAAKARMDKSGEGGGS